MKRNALAFKLLASAPACLPVAAYLATVRPALADPPPPVDVVVKAEPPPRRPVTLEWNPVDILYKRYSVNVQIVPADHHALILTPYYFNSRTAAFLQSSTDAAGNPETLQVDSQRFEGFGGELGYRYYTGLGGPRGFFVGPSLVLNWVQAAAGNGAQTSLADYGFAVDVGYQMLVADSWVVAVGVGAEITWTSKSIPDQQWPANTYANGGFHPRPLLALGYAF